jgi:hypothetical protein
MSVEDVERSRKRNKKAITAYSMATPPLFPFLHENIMEEWPWL